MSARFEVLDTAATSLGVVSLRRRWDPVAGQDVFEVKLDDEFLMSSLFTAAEREVARLALDEVAGEDLDVLVGGLGLGYTAQTVLDDSRVASMVVVEALSDVIGWHERGLVPVSVSADSDPRCRLRHDDFFAMVGRPDADTAKAPPRYDAVIVDIDHSPRDVLHPSHAGFYQPSGVARLRRLMRPGAVFALWSNDPPDEGYLAVLSEGFERVRAEVIAFPNPLQGVDAANTVYLASAP
jgi:spermidine synthase